MSEGALRQVKETPCHSLVSSKPAKTTILLTRAGSEERRLFLQASLVLDLPRLKNLAVFSLS